MRQLQAILHELKALIESQRPGEKIQPPASLPSVLINGHRLYYAPAGHETNPNKDAPSVVLLHGFGGFFMDWPRVMAPIARHAAAYAIDLPGWGFSELNTEAQSIEDDVAAVSKFIEKMELKKVLLCGISYGAGVAWAAAAKRIPEVEQVVLLNPMPTHPVDYIISPLYRAILTLNTSRGAAFIGHKMLRKAQYKLICKENLLDDRLLDTFYLDLAYLVTKQPKISFMLHAHARGAREVNWHEWDEMLAEIDLPVTILQAREDRVFSPEAATRLHQIIPHSELVEVQDSGHAMVFDQHRKIAATLIQILKKMKSSSRRINQGM
jgi:pimeloyl-ACP methyl ester carboxylesterase